MGPANATNQCSGVGGEQETTWNCAYRLLSFPAQPGRETISALMSGITVVLLAVLTAGESPGEARVRPTVTISEDVHVRGRVEWSDADYQIHGNILLHEGGELIANNATIQLMCTYTREFRIQWNGGKMVTDRVTIGGAMYKGTVQSTYFEIQDGTWESSDTTIQFSSGVCHGMARASREVPCDAPYGGAAP